MRCLGFFGWLLQAAPDHLSFVILLLSSSRASGALRHPDVRVSSSVNYSIYFVRTWFTCLRLTPQESVYRMRERKSCVEKTMLPGAPRCDCREQRSFVEEKLADKHYVHICITNVRSSQLVPHWVSEVFTILKLRLLSLRPLVMLARSVRLKWKMKCIRWLIFGMISGDGAGLLKIF